MQMIPWQPRIPLLCRFIRSEEDDASNTWETKLARKYYSQLFREYCIADLSRYQVQIPLVAVMLP